MLIYSGTKLSMNKMADGVPHVFSLTDSFQILTNFLFEKLIFCQNTYVLFEKRFLNGER
mgnify:CR=1 FL=1